MGPVPNLLSEAGEDFDGCWGTGTDNQAVLEQDRALTKVAGDFELPRFL